MAGELVNAKQPMNFKDNSKYRQQNPMGNANALVALMKARGNEFGKIGESMDALGQSQARGKIAELMGNPNTAELNPTQLNSEILSVTGGRDMGDYGNDMVNQLMGTRQKYQDNLDDITAADTLFGRKQLLNNQSDANAMSRVMARNNGNRDSTYSPANDLFNDIESSQIYSDIAHQEDMLRNGDLSQGAINEVNRNIYDMKKTLTGRVNGGRKMTSQQRADLAKTYKPNKQSASNAKIPKNIMKLSVGSGKAGRDAVIESWNSGLLSESNGKLYYDGTQTSADQLARYFKSKGK